MAKKTIALIYGGMSGEHSVSLITAASVLRAIDKEKYDIFPIGITKNGVWVKGVTNPEELESIGFGGQLPEDGQRLTFAMDGSGDVIALSDDGSEEKGVLGHVDVVFPLLHGPFGEDGTLQGLCEMARIPYVGCGVLSSAAAMDKHFMKLVLSQFSLPFVDYVVVRESEWKNNAQKIKDEIMSTLQFPVFVKPARAGSSLGVSKVDKIEQLEQAIKNAYEVDEKVLVETGIDAREIECGILGQHGKMKASVVGEIHPGVGEGDFYDFDAKYTDTEQLRLDIPAHISDELSYKLRSLAVEVGQAFECSGLTRVDFFVTESEDVYINELNTLPGFTSVSMYPQLWEATGISYTELIDLLIDTAHVSA
ncbi:MAG: D-alanine--D-alanine ligase [Actinomycetaceae bacterium]|nr:D-alanine--D-alanine ligase [Actinomycetaceae bacterium]